MNWKPFVLGFLAGAALLSGISHWKTRSQDITATWPNDDRKKGMKMLSPWVSKARSWKLGPFAVFAPSDSSQKTEGMMHPIKGKFPTINISNNSEFGDGPSVSIVDAKNRSLSIKYNELSGDFGSYEFSTNLISGTSFIDRNLDGQYDVKIGPGKSVAVYYNSKWFPVVFKDKKKYLDADNTFKEIEMKDFMWKFTGQ